MNEKKVLGYRKFKSKNGKNCIVLGVSSPYSDRDKQSGACGEKVEELFVPEECHAQVVPAIVGKNVSLQYDISGGRAYLTGFEVCK